MVKRKLWWIAAAALVLIGSYWTLSGFAMSGTDTYDLMAPRQTDANRSWRHKVGEVLLPILYSHDTQYASGFREEAFRAIKVSASQADVRAAIGDPLEKRQLDDGRSMWSYSKHGPKTEDYLLRIVEFDAAGHVLRKHAEFYVD